MSYGIGNDCDCGGPPPCEPGSLRCTTCPDDTVTTYQIRLEGFVNDFCANCEDHNVSVSVSYLDNNNPGAGGPQDCLCHFEAIISWETTLSILSPPFTLTRCTATCTAKFGLWLYNFGNGQGRVLVIINLTCSDVSAGGGVWQLETGVLTCNYFDTEVEIPLQSDVGWSQYPVDCDSSFGTTVLGDPLIKCFVKKL